MLAHVRCVHYAIITHRHSSHINLILEKELTMQVFVREKSDFMSKFRPAKICDGYPDRLKKK